MTQGNEIVKLTRVPRDFEREQRNPRWCGVMLSLTDFLIMASNTLLTRQQGTNTAYQSMTATTTNTSDIHFPPELQATSLTQLYLAC